MVAEKLGRVLPAGHHHQAGGHYRPTMRVPGNGGKKGNMSVPGRQPRKSPGEKCKILTEKPGAEPGKGKGVVIIFYRVRLESGEGGDLGGGRGSHTT